MARIGPWSAVLGVVLASLTPERAAAVACSGWELRQNGTSLFTDVNDACTGGTLLFNYFQQEAYVATETNVSLVCANVTEVQLVNVSLGNLTQLENVTRFQSVTQCRQTTTVVCTCAPGTDIWWPQGVSGPQRCCAQSCPQSPTSTPCGTWVCNTFAPHIQCTRYCCGSCTDLQTIQVPITVEENVTRPRFALQPQNVSVVRCQNVSTSHNVTRTRTSLNPDNCQRPTFANTTVVVQCLHGGCSPVISPPSCVCHDGWTGGGVGGGDCSTDVDECGGAPCGAACTNTLGSFQCSCTTGFELAPNLRDCVDVNECATAAAPLCTATDGTGAAACVNTPGAYRCQCSAGYTLDPQNHRSCVPGNCGGLATPAYCPRGYVSGVNCSQPVVRCNGTTVGHACTFICPDIAFVLEGPVTGTENTASNTYRTFNVPCNTSVQWGEHSRSWCRFSNQPPTDIQMTGGSLAENAPPTLVALLDTVDPDPVERFRYSIVAGAQWFELRGVGEQLWSTVPQDFETAARRAVTISSTDKGNATVTRTFSISILDRNDAPTGVEIQFGGWVSENASVSTAFAFLRAIDVDAVDRHSFEVLSPTAHFTASGALLVYRATDPTFLDYERANSTDLVVRCVDAGGLRASSTLTVAVVDSNDPPRIETQNFVVSESVAPGGSVGVINVTDQDTLQNQPWLVSRPPQTLSAQVVGATAASQFGFQGLNLTVRTALDFEVTPSVVLQVRATDSGHPPLASTANLAVLIRNSDEAPVLVRLVGSVVNETVQESTSQIGSVVGSVEVYDEDLANPAGIAPYTQPRQLFAVGAVTCVVVQGSANMPQELWALYGTGTGRRLQFCSAPLTIAAPLLYAEATRRSVLLNITGPTTATPAAFTVSILNVNQHPTALLLSSTRVQENTPNGVLVAELAALDPDPGNLFFFSLTRNASGGAFAVAGTELVVAREELLDYETTPWFVFNITVQDAGVPPLSASFEVNMTVVDVNEAPTAILLNTSGFPEDLAVGEPVAAVTVLDPDRNQTHSCALNDPFHTFAIGADNVIRLASATVDFERRATYEDLVLTCSDSGVPTLSLTTTIVLNVTNVNEAPTDISLSASAVRENLPAGEVVGYLTTTDADTAGPNGNTQGEYTYTFATRGVTPAPCGADALCPFAVDPTGTLRTTAVLDFETQGAYNLTVTSTDTAGLSVSESLDIAVLDVNDPPTNLFVSPATLHEGVQGARVGQVFVRDEDAGQTHALAISRPTLNDGHMFVLVGTTLRLRPTVAADYELSGPNLTVTLRATDNGLPLGLSVERTLTVTVVNVNEPPSSVGISTVVRGVATRVNTSTIAVPETAAPSPLATLTVGDPDNLGVGATMPQTHVCSVVPGGGGGGRPTTAVFTVLAQGNVLALASGSLNFETADVEHVTVRCVDSGTPPLSIDATLTIAVTNVNEAVSTLALNGTLLDFASGPAQLALPENLPNLTFVGALEPIDPDNCGQPQCLPRQGAVVSIGDLGQTHFRVTPLNATHTSLVATRPFDFEQAVAHALRIVVVDTGAPPLGAQFDIAVTVLDRNDPPGVAITGFTGEVAEDDVIGTVVGSLVISDQDSAAGPNGQHTLSIAAQTAVGGGGGASTALAIGAGGRLVVGNTTALAEAAVLYVAVRVVDHGVPPLEGRLELTLNVLPINHPPVFTRAPPGQVLALENASIGSAIGGFNVSENDPGQTVHCDATVTDCFPSAALCDRGPGRFAVQPHPPSTGYSITLARRLDFESVSSFTVLVQCNDTGVPVRGVSQQLLVTVVDTNDPPSDVRLIPAGGGVGVGVREDAAAGTLVGTVAVTDPDAGQTHTIGLGYSAGETSRPFGVVGNRIVVTAPAELDYETQSSYTVTLSATDSGSPPATATVTASIQVIDVNEPPTGITFRCGCRGSPCLHGGACTDGNLTLGNAPAGCGCILGYTGAHCEISPTGGAVPVPSPPSCLLLSPTLSAGTPLLHLAAVDPDAGQGHTYAIVRATGAGVARFGVSGAVLGLGSRVTPSGSPGGVVSVTLRATDSGGLSVDRTLTFTLSACGSADCDVSHGVCTENATDPRGYSCACAAGYTGDGRTCSLADCGGTPCVLHTCAVTPCHHGGNCTDVVGADGLPTVSCSCAAGHTGPRCDASTGGCDDPLACSGVPGAVCSPTITFGGALRNFSCQCPPGRAGAACQYTSASCAPATCPAPTATCVPLAAGGRCADSDSVAAIWYTYPDCIAVNATEVADCGGAWRLELADVEVFVAISAFPPPAYAVYTVDFAPDAATSTTAGGRGVAARFVVWNTTASAAVAGVDVLSGLAASCLTATTPNMLGLCNFSSTSSGGGGGGTGGVSTTPWGGGGGPLLPTPSPTPADTDDAGVDAAEGSSDAGGGGGGSVVVLIGAIFAIIALLVVGGMVYAKRRANRLGSGSITGPAVTFTNPTFKKQIDAENARMAAASAAAAMSDPSRPRPTPEDHGYLETEEGQGYLDIEPAKTLPRHGQGQRRTSRYEYGRTEALSNPLYVYSHAADDAPEEGGGGGQSGPTPATSALTRTVRGGTWSKSAALEKMSNLEDE